MSALETLDSISLNFDSGSLHLLNIAIGFVMFGVALEIKLNSYKDILLAPKPVILGFISQFFIVACFYIFIDFTFEIMVNTYYGIGNAAGGFLPGRQCFKFYFLFGQGQY
jgi:BASS family bile acid:Na+ symporter